MGRPPEPYFPHDHDTNEHYPRVRFAGLAFATFAFVFLAGVLLLAAVHLAIPKPSTELHDQPIVIDSGWHRALDPYGVEYTIVSPYAAMNDVQREDADRFARQYPDGRE